MQTLNKFKVIIDHFYSNRFIAFFVNSAKDLIVAILEKSTQ